MISSPGTYETHWKLQQAVLAAGGGGNLLADWRTGSGGLADWLGGLADWLAVTGGLADWGSTASASPKTAPTLYKTKHFLDWAGGLADWRTTGGLADWRTGGLADWRTGGDFWSPEWRTEWRTGGLADWQLADWRTVQH